METLDHRYVQLDRVDGETKAEFIRKTYTHVAGAVLVFMILEAFLLSLPGVQNFATKMVSSGGTWLLIMGGFMLLSSLAQNMANQTHNVQRQYLGLGIIHSFIRSHLFTTDNVCTNKRRRTFYY
jgi:FtsH-binding integral membrane protein